MLLAVSVGSAIVNFRRNPSSADIRRYLPLGGRSLGAPKANGLPTARSCIRAIDNRPYQSVGCVSLSHLTAPIFNPSPPATPPFLSIIYSIFSLI